MTYPDTVVCSLDYVSHYTGNHMVPTWIRCIKDLVAVCLGYLHFASCCTLYVRCSIGYTFPASSFYKMNTLIAGIIHISYINGCDPHTTAISITFFFLCYYIPASEQSTCLLKRCQSHILKGSFSFDPLHIIT